MTAVEANATTSVLTHRHNYLVGAFVAMASPCEILVDDLPRLKASELLEIAKREAYRIEQKFSRYRSDNIIHRINASAGKPIKVDEETAKILDYAEECWQISEGLFDITSGVLRKVWKFDGSDRLPDQSAIEQILPKIGWEKVKWEKPHLTLPTGMEIDLGGIGKEYAVDTTSSLLRNSNETSFVVNFGGDLFVREPRSNGEFWSIGVDDPKAIGVETIGTLNVASGGIATSGDATRFLIKDGVRYSHILNPKTGWSVLDAPHSVTVIADTCIEAGILATIAVLHGAKAEAFLQAQRVKHIVQRA